MSTIFSNIKKKKKKNVIRIGPPLAKLSGSAHAWVDLPCVIVASTDHNQFLFEHAWI